MLIEPLPSDVRIYFVENAPTLLPLFEIYAEEAAFGWRYVASDIARLQAGAKVIEVGARSLQISCQLARAGFEVKAIEPIGSGCPHFDQTRQLVHEQPLTAGKCSTWLA